MRIATNRIMKSQEVHGDWEIVAIIASWDLN